ncbi:MAG: RT0821/Lpp0805 family surface protein [Alphaproteobacteria bacterium]|nr:RT0821/Lpp0805 family surface protein [Alphaproteobacteria bacterium]
MTRFNKIAAGLVTLQLGACAMISGDNTRLYESLNDQDIRLAAATVQQSLETAPDQTTRTWSNSVSGRGGSVTPTRTYLSANGLFCRDYVEELTSEEGKGSFHNTACRDDTERWTWL